MKKEIYLDNSATTFVKKEVLDEMLPYFTKEYGNPSASYYKGAVVRNKIEVAREKIAKILRSR